MSREFVEFARIAGVIIKDDRPSDRIRRCGTVTHPRSTNGAYQWDGQRGWVWRWDEPTPEPHWYGEKGREWTEEDKAEWRRARDAERRRQALRQVEVAHESEQILRGARIERHGYLNLKGHPTVRGFVRGDNEELLVPMRDVRSNKLIGLQRIYWDPSELKWIKKMLAGQRAKGAVFAMGNKAFRETILCEGYATGLSILAAIDQLRLPINVVVAFSAANMVYVAEHLPGRKMVYADNDESKAGEEAAKATGLPYVMSDVVGNDANDDHQQFGLFHVCSKIMKLRSMPIPEKINEPTSVR